MPPPHSAGVLLFRQRVRTIEVLLIKPGGPFWRNKDAGAWMIPKGKVEAGEAPAEAALREFAEETGTRLTAVPFPLAVVRQAGEPEHRRDEGEHHDRTGQRDQRAQSRPALKRCSHRTCGARAAARVAGSGPGRRL